MALAREVPARPNAHSAGRLREAGLAARRIILGSTLFSVWFLWGIHPKITRRGGSRKSLRSGHDLMDLLKRLLALGLLPLLLLACSEPENGDEGGWVAPWDLVYVAAEDFSVSLEISVQTEAVAGEWITISAKRRSGPWKQVRRFAVPRREFWYARQPQEIEPEVAENVWWETDPPRAARTGTLPGCCWLPRTAMFAKPGTYKIWALTLPGRTKSNVVTVTIHSPK
jgi:hypothetical protein